MREPTAEESRILEEAAALDELIKSHGWKILSAICDEAIQKINEAKTTLPTMTEDGRNLALEAIGRQYLSLEERAFGISAILGEVKARIRQAAKIREAISSNGQPTPTGP